MSNTESLSLAETLRMINDLLKRRFKVLVIFGFIGLALGFAINLLPKTYVSSFTVESQSVPASVFSEIILSINAAIDQGDTEYIMTKCECDEAVAKSFGLLNAEQLQVPGTTSAPLNQVRIKMEIKNPSLTKDMENCIVQILHNNEVVERMAAIYKTSREEILLKLNEEILQLDSFQNSYDRYLIGDKPAPLGIYANGSHSAMLSLLERQLKFKTEIEFADSFYKITDATVPQKPTFGLTVSMLIGLTLSMFTALILILILEAKLLMRQP